MQRRQDLSQLMKLSEKAGLSMPEQRILAQFLKEKLEGDKGALTAYEVIGTKDVRIQKPKVYTHLKKLSELNLIETVGSERPSKYRVKGSVKDVVNELELIALERIKREVRKIESVKNDLGLLAQQVYKELSMSGPKIEMDFYGVDMGAEIHKKAFIFLEKLKPKEEILAITPSALIWSVPEQELKEEPSMKRYRDTLAKYMFEKKIYTKYICFLDWYLTKPPRHRLDRLQTLLGNVKELPNLELVDASPHRKYISASPTLIIFGSQAVIVGLKGNSRNIDKGVIFTGKDVVNFFKDLFYTTYGFLKEENLKSLKIDKKKGEYQDENTRLKSYIISRLTSLIETK